MTDVVVAKRSSSILLFLFLFNFLLECIPQEAEARGRRSFGRRVASRGAVRRVNQNRGVVRRNVGIARRNFRNNNDLFGLDQEPVNVFSSLALNPFGQLQPLVDGRGNVISGVATDGSGRFFAVNRGLSSNVIGLNRNFGVNNVGFDANLGNLTNNLQVQAELLRTGNNFFGGINATTGSFVPTSGSEAFNQIQFLNTLGSLNTSCNGRFCQFR